MKFKDINEIHKMDDTTLYQYQNDVNMQLERVLLVDVAAVTVGMIFAVGVGFFDWAWYGIVTSAVVFFAAMAYGMVVSRHTKKIEIIDAARMKRFYKILREETALDESRQSPEEDISVELIEAAQARVRADVALGEITPKWIVRISQTVLA